MRYVKTILRILISPRRISLIRLRTRRHLKRLFGIAVTIIIIFTHTSTMTYCCVSPNCLALGNPINLEFYSLIHPWILSSALALWCHERKVASLTVAWMYMAPKIWKWRVSLYDYIRGYRYWLWLKRYLHRSLERRCSENCLLLLRWLTLCWRGCVSL